MTIQKICDIFLFNDEKNIPRLPPLLLRQYPLFERSVEGFSAGFLGLNIPRLEGVFLAMTFRKANIRCLNVPVEYRDQRKLSVEEALLFCKDRFNASAYIPSGIYYGGGGNHPMQWVLGRELYPEEYQGAPKEGGYWIAIDKLDGHIWTAEEHDVYAYDYNNQM
jgi:hypothetical protein